MYNYSVLTELDNAKGTEERSQMLDSVFNTSSPYYSEIKKNILYSELKSFAEHVMSYSGLKGYDKDDTYQFVLIELERTKLASYATKPDKSLSSFLRNIIKHAQYESIAENKGISVNDFQKLVCVTRVSQLEKVDMEERNAWLLARLSNIPMTTVLRAISNYKMLQFLDITEETDRYLAGKQADSLEELITL